LVISYQIAIFGEMNRRSFFKRLGAAVGGVMFSGPAVSYMAQLAQSTEPVSMIGAHQLFEYDWEVLSKVLQKTPRISALSWMTKPLDAKSRKMTYEYYEDKFD